MPGLQTLQREALRLHQNPHLSTRGWTCLLSRGSQVRVLPGALPLCGSCATAVLGEAPRLASLVANGSESSASRFARSCATAVLREAPRLASLAASGSESTAVLSHTASRFARRERERVLPGGGRLAFGPPQMGSNPPSGSTATRRQRFRVLTHQSAVNRMRLLCSSCFTHVLQAQ